MSCRPKNKGEAFRIYGNRVKSFKRRPRYLCKYCVFWSLKYRTPTAADIMPAVIARPPKRSRPSASAELHSSFAVTAKRIKRPQSSDPEVLLKPLSFDKIICYGTFGEANASITR